MLQTLPLQPAAWEILGYVCPGQGRASGLWHPPLALSRSPASPLRLPHPPPFSPRLGTLVTVTMMMVQSTLLLVTWVNAVAVTLEAPPRGVSKARPRTNLCKGVPYSRPHQDVHLFQRAREGWAGDPEDTCAHFLTQGSIRNSGTVS